MSDDTGNPSSGDPCPNCGGRLVVVNSFASGDYRVRYLGCRACGYRPPNNRLVVPLRYAPPRNFATSSKVGGKK